jgi:DNA invertase Pin-like site-specific DNA recombinase
MVTRLDRLACSTAELLIIAERLRDQGAGLQSLDEPWADTISPSGRMVLTVFAGIAEFERALIKQHSGRSQLLMTQHSNRNQAAGLGEARIPLVVPHRAKLGRLAWRSGDLP